MEIDKVREAAVGIRRWKVNLGQWKAEVEKIAADEGFTTIASAESPAPALSPEHKHSGDEVRLVLTGSGYFLTRVGETEDVFTSHFAQGEMISMPKGVWHKLGPGEASYTSVRFYHDKATWNKTLRE